MRNAIRLACATLLASLTLLVFQGGPASAAGFHAVGTPAQQTATAPLAGSWVPYDNAHITTQQKCINRMNWLKQQYPGDRFRCEEFPNGLCPPGYYWMVMIYAAPLVTAASQDSVQAKSPAGSAAC